MEKKMETIGIMGFGSWGFEEMLAMWACFYTC